MNGGRSRAGRRSGLKHLGVVASLGLSLVGCGSPAATPTPMPEGASAQGLAVYKARCASCHNPVDRKAPLIVGRRLEPGRVEAAVRRGEGGHLVYSQTVLSDDRLAALMAYLDGEADRGQSRD